MRVAVIGPKTFNLMSSICNEITHQGHEVIFIDERSSNSIFSKILYRLGINNLLEKILVSKHKANILNKLKKFSPDMILLLDVETIDRKFISKIKEISQNIHLYMWDSSINKSRFLEILDLVSKKMTFDPNDAKKYDMNLVHLFSSFSADENIQKNIDVYFCGTLHSDRPTAMVYLKNQFKESKINFKFDIFYHSKTLAIFQSIFNVNWLKILKNINTEGFDIDHIKNMTNRSKIILDMPHPNQSGLTCRTFEALQSNCLLITTNKNCIELLPSFSHRIRIAKDFNDMLNIVQKGLEEDLGAISSDQKFFCSIKRFVKEVIND